MCLHLVHRTGLMKARRIDHPCLTFVRRLDDWVSGACLDRLTKCCFCWEAACWGEQKEVDCLPKIYGSESSSRTAVSRATFVSCILIRDIPSILPKSHILPWWVRRLSCKARRRCIVAIYGIALHIRSNYRNLYCVLLSGYCCRDRPLC